VLFVQEQGDSRALLYVRAALEAAGQSASAWTRPRRGSTRSGALRMVVLSDAPVQADFEAVLKHYVNNGGGVLVTLGRAIAARRRVPLLDYPGGRVGGDRAIRPAWFRRAGAFLPGGAGGCR